MKNIKKASNGFYFYLKIEHTYASRRAHMDFHQYFKTPLEQWIEEKYKEHNILTAQNL